MNEILIAGSIMLGIACFFGLVLAVANRYLAVEEDPRVEQVEQMLPGTNCGACGQPGCKAFAEVIVEGAEPPGKCSVSSAEGVEKIAAFLGVDAGFQEKIVAGCTAPAESRRCASSPTTGGSRLAARPTSSTEAAKPALGAASVWATATWPARSTRST